MKDFSEFEPNKTYTLETSPGNVYECIGHISDGTVVMHLFGTSKTPSNIRFVVDPKRWHKTSDGVTKALQRALFWPDWLAHSLACAEMESRKETKGLEDFVARITAAVTAAVLKEFTKE
jgi:hypothetical protein